MPPSDGSACLQVGINTGFAPGSHKKHQTPRSEHGRISSHGVPSRPKGSFWGAASALQFFFSDEFAFPRRVNPSGVNQVTRYDERQFSTAGRCGKSHLIVGGFGHVVNVHRALGNWPLIATRLLITDPMVCQGHAPASDQFSPPTRTRTRWTFPTYWTSIVFSNFSKSDSSNQGDGRCKAALLTTNIDSVHPLRLPRRPPLRPPPDRPMVPAAIAWAAKRRARDKSAVTSRLHRVRSDN